MTLHEYIRQHVPKPFNPGKPFYSERGDFVIAYWKGDDHYAETVSPEVTVYKSFDGDRVVGVQIHGVKKLVEPRP